MQMGYNKINKIQYKDTNGDTIYIESVILYSVNEAKK